MEFLRSNTAVIVSVGPFYDKTDGVTIETALTITNERITAMAATDDGAAPTLILDNITGATSGTANDLNYITGGDNGMMQLELSAANVNRVGRFKITITDAANHVPVFHSYFIFPQAIYDWLTGVIVPLPANVTQLLGTAWLTPGTAGTPDTNVKLISGDSSAADNLEAEYDGTGYKSYLRRFTAQAGGTATITLDASASATDNIFTSLIVAILSGTGAGQARLITGYVGSTKVATVNTAWITNPSSSSVCVLVPFDLAGILAEIVANVATLPEIVTAIDNDSTQLENIADSTSFLADKMGWIFLQYTAYIGATGNDTTHLHLPGAGSLADDTLNNCLLVIYDVSTTLTYSRWIEDWTTTGDLATVATLPFTPEASVDTYAILTTRRDVTVAAGLDAAGVRTAVGMASANMDAQLGTIENRMSPIVTKTGAVVSDGGNSATTFVTNLTESVNDYWKDAWFRLTSGALINQVKKCTAYNGTTKAITVSGGYTGTPASGVTFEVIND